VKARWIVGAAIVVGVIGYAMLGRRWQLRWGASPEEASASLPGDGLIPSPDLVATRAITIGAPADRVWPWIAQMGQGRGGLYSYDALENLVGCDIHSADRIVPEWQDVAVGDDVWLHPDVALQVALVEPGAALVVRGAVEMGASAPAPPYDFTWSFSVHSGEDAMTRLIVRERYGFTRWWAPLLMEPIELASFVMSQKMLRGIRDRAERTVSLAGG